MKLFAYSLREFDELPYLRKICNDLGIEMDYTSEYPNLSNAHLAKGYDAVSIITNQMQKKLLDVLYEGGVRFITTRTIGYDHIDIDYAKKLGMKCFHATYSPDSVANYTIMMMLMACRNMPFIMETAKMQNFSLEGKMGKEISECTIGVIGTGRIGETLIRHLSGFGCKILAYDLYEKEQLASYATYVSLEELYKESDIITLHAPVTKDNYHMLNLDSFLKMKDGVIIVNAARGALIDTKALITCLKNGKVSFAALDTIEDEASLYYHDLSREIIQNDDRAILESFPNVLLSPHMAFYTGPAVRDMCYTVTEALNDVFMQKTNALEI